MIHGCCMWSKMKPLISPPAQQDAHRLPADDFQTHFSKVQKIRDTTASAPAPKISAQSIGLSLSIFTPVSTAEIARLLSFSPAKLCQLDPVPAWIAKKAAEVLSPVLTVMCNASLLPGLLRSLTSMPSSSRV